MMEDIVKREYDRTLREFVERLRVIEREARACSEQAGYRDGIAMRIQADIVETIHSILQSLVDRGGMPPLDCIDEVSDWSLISIQLSEYNDDEKLRSELVKWKE